MIFQNKLTDQVYCLTEQSLITRLFIDTIHVLNLFWNSFVRWLIRYNGREISSRGRDSFTPKRVCQHYLPKLYLCNYFLGSVNVFFLFRFKRLFEKTNFSNFVDAKQILLRAAQCIFSGRWRALQCLQGSSPLLYRRHFASPIVGIFAKMIAFLVVELMSIGVSVFMGVSYFAGMGEKWTWKGLRGSTLGAIKWSMLRVACRKKSHPLTGMGSIKHMSVIRDERHYLWCCDFSCFIVLF